MLYINKYDSNKDPIFIKIVNLMDKGKRVRFRQRQGMGRRLGAGERARRRHHARAGLSRTPGGVRDPHGGLRARPGLVAGRDCERQGASLGMAGT